MKSFLLFFLALCLAGCKFNTEAATADITLSDNDIALFSKLNTLLLRDKTTIRKKALEHTSASGVDTLLLSTGSSYLYTIDKAAYKPLITALQKRDLLDNGISIGFDNTVVFNIRNTTDRHYDDYNHSYDHDLIFENGAPKYNYSGIQKMYTDRKIANGIRYVCYMAYSGH